MKHGIKLRKLQRTPSHRAALLRNLVSALLHHEVIKTTVPKAKEAARLAEKIISHGKRGTDPARRAAQAFLFPGHHYTPVSPYEQPVAPTRAPGYDLETSDPETFQASTSLLPKVFGTLAERYAERPGGYTRITKFGRRPGDYAPVALVSLVDGPRDIKFELTARAAARESAVLANYKGRDALPDGFDTSKLRERTAQSVNKVLKYRGDKGKQEFAALAKEFSDKLVVESAAVGHRRSTKETEFHFNKPSLTAPLQGRRVLAGERFPGISVRNTGLGLARGALARHSGKRNTEALFVSERRGDKAPVAEVD
ncbi:50S ribosomal protein L17 [Vanrija pseudolonga]|uniref:50S ribosomal protein L17 n=1 Tax=Vanrija pseudolonga TaxID=143232 RepID=A0AAF0Y2P3_9TREE|nr:50S ribosomal protein L17 [Vanrija pseudolonga]